MILMTFIYTILVSVVDFIILQIGGIVFSVETGHLLNEQSLERCGCVLISKLLLCILIYFIHKYAQKDLDLPKKYIFLICLITGVLISFDFYMVEEYSVTKSDDIRIFSMIFFAVSIVLIILILGIVLMLVENYKQRQDISLLELQNEMFVTSEKNLENAFQMWRSSIHDYKHKIYILQHWLEEGKIQEIKDFVAMESENLTNKMFYIKTGNEVVDAIVNTKQNIAEEKGIVFSVNISIPKSCRISDIDLVCILGNLIDNAIEACENQSKKRIEIIIKEVKKFLYIKIINSYEGELSQEMTTTKKEKLMHGIGLKNVKSIVAKYDGTYEMVKDNGEVTTNIVILK